MRLILSKDELWEFMEKMDKGKQQTFYTNKDERFIIIKSRDDKKCAMK